MLQNVDKYLRNCGLNLLRCVMANFGVHMQSVSGSYSQSLFEDNKHLRSGSSSFCFSTIYACGRQLNVTWRTIAVSALQAMMVSPLYYANSLHHLLMCRSKKDMCFRCFH